MYPAHLGTGQTITLDRAPDGHGEFLYDHAYVAKRRMRELHIAATLDPRDMNLYVYVANNPLNLVDPTGETAVSTGVKSCQGYQKGHWLFGWFSIHDFLVIDGMGIGCFERNLNVCGTGLIREDDLQTYPESDPRNVKPGDFHSVCSTIMVDDTCRDPLQFAASVRQCIARRLANPGIYIAGLQDCKTFVKDCLLKARYDSLKPGAPYYCTATGGYAR